MVSACNSKLQTELIWQNKRLEDPYKFWFYELRNANDIQGTRGTGNSR